MVCLSGSNYTCRCKLPLATSLNSFPSCKQLLTAPGEKLLVGGMDGGDEGGVRNLHNELDVKERVRKTYKCSKKGEWQSDAVIQSVCSPRPSGHDGQGSWGQGSCSISRLLFSWGLKWLFLC